MKKLYGFILLVFLFIGCNNSISMLNTVSESIEENVLPNGFVLTPEKEKELLDFTNAFCSDNGCRTILGSENFEIDENLEKEFIEALEEQFGEESELYYGNELVYCDDKEIPCIYDEELDKLIPVSEINNSRSVSSIDPSYVIKSKISYVKHWGLWWQYYTITVNLYAESIYTTQKFNLKTDEAYYDYTDSVTNKSGHLDWTKFDNPYENGYPTGNSSEAIAAQVKWAIAENNRGIIDVRGNTKYGWLPKVYNSSLHVIWIDDYLLDKVIGLSYVAQ